MKEIYHYWKQELLAHDQVLHYPKGKDGDKKKAEIHNVFAPLIHPGTRKKEGFINFTNNTTKIQFKKNMFSFNTSIGTIQTRRGTLVVNYSYNEPDSSGLLPQNSIVTGKPTYKSGEYLKYKNVQVSVQSKKTGLRILVIESL